MQFKTGLSVHKRQSHEERTREHLSTLVLAIEVEIKAIC